MTGAARSVSPINAPAAPCALGTIAPIRCVRLASASASRKKPHALSTSSCGYGGPGLMRLGADFSQRSLPSSNNASFTLVLPMSRTATVWLIVKSKQKYVVPAASCGRNVAPKSEIEVLDVLLGEDERRPEQDFAAIDHGQLAELAGIHRSRAGL